MQRELLLNTILQNTPVAMLLCDPRGRIVYANIAARKLLNDGRRMEGHALDTLIESAPLGEALERGGDGLFAVPREDDEDEVYRQAQRQRKVARALRMQGA